MEAASRFAALLAGLIDRMFVQQHLAFSQPALPAPRVLRARQRASGECGQRRRLDR